MTESRHRAVAVTEFKNERVLTGPPLDPALRPWFLAHMHKLVCCPSETILEGRKKGRNLWREDLMPAYGSAECDCHNRTFHYNGHVV